MLDNPCKVAKSGFGSSDIVFFLPRLVVPGFFGPTIDDVYLIISVSGGKRTPSNDDGSLFDCVNETEKERKYRIPLELIASAKKNSCVN